ncbi:MAG: S24 family peptidase [Caulobacteraceae bacterium]
MLAELAERIEARLKAVGITHREASLRAGLHEDAIRNIRRALDKSPRSQGRVGVSSRTLAALAPVLQTSVTWLVTGTESPRVAAIPFVAWDDLIGLTEPGWNPAEVGRMTEEFGAWREGCFATRVRDDAMGLVSPPGSVLIVDPRRNEVEDGGFYVGVYEGKAVFRRWYTNPERAEPMSRNPGHKAIYASSARPWIVLGLVVRSMLDLNTTI